MDEKFYEKIKDIIIFKTIKDEFVTLKDYMKQIKKNMKIKYFIL